MVELLSRTLGAARTPSVRVSLLILAALFVLAEEFGFESIFGAFAAGMVVGLGTRGEQGAAVREKLEAVTFGWFYPFFFVGIGVKLDLHALTRDLATMLMVPGFVLLFFLVRGVPIFLYRHELGGGHLPTIRPLRCAPVGIHRRGHHGSGNTGAQHHAGRRGGPHRRCRPFDAHVSDSRRWPPLEVVPAKGRLEP